MNVLQSQAHIWQYDLLKPEVRKRGKIDAGP